MKVKIKEREKERNDNFYVNNKYIIQHAVLML